MEQLKQYLKDRLEFLQQVADADKSENCISTLGQIHEIKVTLDYIKELEDKKPCNN